MSTNATTVDCPVEKASSELSASPPTSSQTQTLYILSRLTPKVFSNRELSGIQNMPEVPSSDTQNETCLGSLKRSGKKAKTYKIPSCSALPPIVKLTRSEQSNRTRWTYVYPDELPASVKATHAQSAKDENVKVTVSEQESQATYIWRSSGPPTVKTVT